jgi:hypothetical protein
MGLWIELGVFFLVFLFAIHQLRDLKKEKQKREHQMGERSQSNTRGSEKEP